MDQYSKMFRFTGDFLSVSGKVALARKIKNTNSLSGISLKTQILYLIVYCARYIDLFSIGGKWGRMRIYNQIMKIVYISFQVYLISLFYGSLKYTYSKKYDTFNIPIFLFVGGILSFVFKNDTFSLYSYVDEYLYTLSLILESLAILPQLALCQDSGECEKLTAIYITLNGLYRLNYLMFFMISHFNGITADTLMIVTSLIQSVLYADFFRVYFTSLQSKIPHIK